MLVQKGGNGFSPPPLSLDSLNGPGEWTDVTLPHYKSRDFAELSGDGGDTLKTSFTLTSWFRFDVPEISAARPGIYLYVPSWKGDGQIAIYANERLIYQSQANFRWNASARPLWLPLDGQTPGQTPREIVIRIQHLPGIGGALSSIWIGNQRELYWRYLAREWLQVDFPYQSGAAFLALGVFACFVWLRRKHEQLYLLFFVTSAAGYIRTMYYYVGQNLLPLPDAWFSWLIVNSMFWMLSAVHASLTLLHVDHYPWVKKSLYGISIFIGLLTCPAMPGFVEATVVAPWVAMLLLIVGFATFFLNSYESWRQRAGDSLGLSLWGVFCMFLGVYDWALHNNLVSIEGIFLSSYLNVGTFYIFTFIMYRRYVGAIAESEKVNSNLAQHLRKREEELFESHRRLRDIEQKELLRIERNRMMQDMHDGLGSSLVSALRVVERGTMSDTDLKEVLKSCIDDLKLTIDSLEPVDADLLLLLATLRFRLGPRLEQAGINLHWDIQDVPPLNWLSPRNSLHILRILQEAFTNIIKHTEATDIWVSTATETGNVFVRIRDNGPGFDLQKAKASGGRGLSNQTRRAQAIAAKVSWETDSDGTLFQLCLPISM
jgi:signal transduction histidine kinase